MTFSSDMSVVAKLQLLGLCTLTCLIQYVCGQDGFDDDLEGLGHTAPPEAQPQAQPQSQGFNPAAWLVPPGAGKVSGLRIRKPEHYWVEGTVFIVLVMYSIVWLRGRSANERIAKAFTSHVSKKGGVLDSNFAQVGDQRRHPRLGSLMKLSQSQFRLWASGRRCTPLRQLCAWQPMLRRMHPADGVRSSQRFAAPALESDLVNLQNASLKERTSVQVLQGRTLHNQFAASPRHIPSGMGTSGS